MILQPKPALKLGRHLCTAECAGRHRGYYEDLEYEEFKYFDLDYDDIDEYADAFEPMIKTNRKVHHNRKLKRKHKTKKPHKCHVPNRKIEEEAPYFNTYNFRNRFVYVITQQPTYDSLTRMTTYLNNYAINNDVYLIRRSSLHLVNATNAEHLAAVSNDMPYHLKQFHQLVFGVSLKKHKAKEKDTLKIYEDEDYWAWRGGSLYYDEFDRRFYDFWYAHDGYSAYSSDSDY